MKNKIDFTDYLEYEKENENVNTFSSVEISCFSQIIRLTKTKIMQYTKYFDHVFAKKNNNKSIILPKKVLNVSIKII